MGLLRLLLAISVIASHTDGRIGIPSPSGHILVMTLLNGRQAVVLFFIISGFYMSMVLKTKYASEHGVKAFYVSRYLRLLPGYLIVVGISEIFNHSLAAIWNSMTNFNLLTKLSILFSNLFIIGTDLFWFISFDQNGSVSYDPFTLSATHNGSNFLVNSPIFTVSIELLFYLIAPLFVTSFKRSFIVFLFSIVYFLVIQRLRQANIIFQYHFFPADLLYFSIGALIYQLSALKEIKPPKILYLLIVAAIIGFMSAPMLISNILILCSALCIPFLFNLTKDNSIDNTLGDLSYLVYIIHFPVIVFLRTHALASEYQGLAVASITLVISVLLFFLFERNINKYRNILVQKILRT